MYSKQIIAFQEYLDFYHLNYNKIRDANMPFSETHQIAIQLGDLQDACVKSYGEKLINDYPTNFVEVYHEDIKTAALKFDMAVLTGLVNVPISDQQLMPLSDEVSLFVASTLADLAIHVSDSKLWEALRNIEQLMDVYKELDYRLLPVLIKLLDNLNTRTDVDLCWVSVYTLHKMIFNIEKGRTIFEALKPYRNHSCSSIREEITEYLQDYYLNEGLADEKYEWKL